MVRAHELRCRNLGCHHVHSINETRAAIQKCRAENDGPQNVLSLWSHEAHHQLFCAALHPRRQNAGVQSLQ